MLVDPAIDERRFLTRSTLALALTLITAPVSAPAITFPRQATEPPPRLMVVFKALLNASHRSGLSLGLLFNVAYAESSFRSDCVTWRHGVITARGLMQINPRYQDFLVRRYMPWLNPVNFDWANAEQNAMLGALYLADLIHRYGEWRGLAGYNAGPGRLNEWPMHRSLPSETWAYVRKVLCAS